LHPLPVPCLYCQLNNLYDMQHMWYEVRSGDAYMAAGELPKALKKYTSVSKHFAGMWEHGVLHLVFASIVSKPGRRTACVGTGS
jgi:hypothetical protein